MAFEGAQSLGYEYRTHRAALSARLAELLETGMNIGYAEYVSAQHDGEGRDALRIVLADYDVLITPAAPGEAPVGLEGTGDPVFNRLWTMLGVPAVTVPVASGPNGMPIGVQLIGAWDRDRELLAIAHRIDERVRAVRPPSGP
jgi:Asp-tRNA(Asn)/Glu-tRNA(Gln) amidotransferase A subunit family amidase